MSVIGRQMVLEAISLREVIKGVNMDIKTRGPQYCRYSSLKNYWRGEKLAENRLPNTSEESVCKGKEQPAWSNATDRLSKRRTENNH